MLFPEIQDEVQKELDTVIGSDRLPDMNDFESLPYMRQTIKEGLRCRFSCPLMPPNLTPLLNILITPYFLMLVK